MTIEIKAILRLAEMQQEVRDLENTLWQHQRDLEALRNKLGVHLGTCSECDMQDVFVGRHLGGWLCLSCFETHMRGTAPSRGDKKEIA